MNWVAKSWPELQQDLGRQFLGNASPRLEQAKGEIMSLVDVSDIFTFFCSGREGE